MKVIRLMFVGLLSLLLSSCIYYKETKYVSTTDVIVYTPRPTKRDEEVKEDKVNEMIKKMSLEEKIGQIVITGYDRVDEVIDSDINFGGIILFKKNIPSGADTKADILKLNKSFNIPMFISVDQEGGRVSRLPKEYGTFESALSVGETNDLTYAYNFGANTGTALKDIGFNLNFAPVCDIFSNPNNTVIADRAFGREPERVSKMAVEVLKGLRDRGVIPTVKHFPGHGDTVIDSHKGLPVVEKSLNELFEYELVPFKEAIKNDVEMIMVGHIVIKKVDSLPCTLSRKLITEVLREEMNYTGVVITDDLGMNAISNEYSIEEASVMAFNAGCDIILCSQSIEKGKRAYNALLDGYNQGEISEERLNESVYRILKLKEKYKIIEG